MTADARRNALAAVAAVLVLGALALYSRSGSVVERVVGPATPAHREVATVGTPSRTGAAASLEERYKPILDAEPSHARSFKREARPAGRPPEPERAADPAAGLVALRLTGIVDGPKGPLALLEDRPRGKGSLLKAGDRLGERTVAEVRSESFVLALAGSVGTPSSAATTVKLGDRLELPRAVIEPLLGPLGPPIAGESGPLPVLTDEARESVLERLRAKRRASEGGK